MSKQISLPLIVTLFSEKKKNKGTRFEISDNEEEHWDFIYTWSRQNKSVLSNRN